MNLYRVLPPPSETIPFDHEEDRLAVLATLDPPRLPWVRAIMVTTSQGEYRGSNGTSAGLTKGADRTLLGLYRKSASLVLTGATTVRSEPVPVPRSTPLCVVSSSGDLSGHQIISSPDRTLFIVTTEEGASLALESTRDQRPVILTTGPAGSLTSLEIIDCLSPHVDTSHLLIEGGRLLWETFATETNELVVSVTPPPTSNHQGIPDWWPGDRSAWTLTSLMTDDEKMLYFRYETGLNGVASTDHPEPA